jgi:hypothetical protein
MEKNSKKARWQSRGLSSPDLELLLTRNPDGTLSITGRGAPYDSVEFVTYVAKYSPTNPPSLGMPFPNRVEYHGILRHPDTAYAHIAEIPDGTNGGDLRNYNAGVILLKAWGGKDSSESERGGIYSGKCTDPLRHTPPPGGLKLTGYIDANGSFCFRCFGSEQDPGSTTTGRIGNDNVIYLQYHNAYGQYYSGLSDTTDNLRFTWHGDSLSATFHYVSAGGIPDSSHIEAVRGAIP